MTIDEAFAILNIDELNLIASAGPAVLRLKLLEATAILHRRVRQDKVTEAAAIASAVLRRLVMERPCISIADRNAREKVLAAPGVTAQDSTNIFPLRLRRRGDTTIIANDRSLSKDARSLFG